MPEPVFEIVDINTLTPRKDNPNELTDEQMKSLDYAIDRFGFLQPLVINQDGIIVDGAHRYDVLRERGIEQVRVSRVITKDENELKLLSQTLNKLRGSHDLRKDISEMEILMGYNPDELQSLLGFDETGLDLMRQQLVEQEEQLQRLSRGQQKEETEADLDKLPVPEEITEPITKTGDIWKLGNHYLMCGDCTKEEDVDKLLQGKTVDLLLTDPPYGVNYTEEKEDYLDGLSSNGRSHKGVRVKIDIINDNLKEYVEFYSSFLKIIPFSDYSICYSFMFGLQLHNFRIALESLKFKWFDYLIWVKNSFVFGRKDYKGKHEFIVYFTADKHKFYGENNCSTVIEFNKNMVNDLHPTMKPIGLLVKLIGDGSQQNMVVYDPFMGSGSTLIACEQTNRQCFGLEIDPRYCDVCVTRWENLTGQKAELIKQG